MKMQEIGAYLTRTIEICRIEKIEMIKNINKLNDSVLLIYLSSRVISIDKLEELIDNIISLTPLAIELAGDFVEKTFDILLNKLSQKETPHHIMTKTCRNLDFNEIIDDYILSTWPAEKSFDAWKKYSIIFLGNKIIYNEFLKKIKFKIKN